MSLSQLNNLSPGAYRVVAARVVVVVVPAAGVVTTASSRVVVVVVVDGVEHEVRIAANASAGRKMISFFISLDALLSYRERTTR